MDYIVPLRDPFVRLFPVCRNESGFLLTVSDIEKFQVFVECFSILEDFTVIELTEGRRTAVAGFCRVSYSAGENTE